MTDEEGAADHVALIGFANYVQVLCPFTLDAEAMQTALAEVELETRRNLDGTAIGASVTDAVRLLGEIDSKSKIVVCLTDGKETTGVIDPMDAARFAAEEGVKVYTIFAGAKFETRFDHLARQRVRVPIDPGPLPAMAELTGARFFHAADEAELTAAYDEIERLERTPRKEEAYAEFHDRYPAWVFVAMCLFAIGQLSRATWARRLP
jgi:Ca-activated chloride channel family protein